ncbi:hypothetical protein AURDEDRAFT_173059 [Auricularia subglabra TFB-10046 SS5]|uniref:Uncharacterized protein n=1 Tax=Auricularia subglabra (strain TFB-10046 / SS5) TaxID=717982 RepID=J0LI28_AURST|nr:hypothetical protein AURDEDRAFT_173059 [Auricularia subglabra TFB-10046 SS5]
MRFSFSILAFSIALSIAQPVKDTLKGRRPVSADQVNEYLEDYLLEEWEQQFPNYVAPTFPKVQRAMKIPVWYNMKFYTPDLQTLAARDTRDVAYASPARSKKETNDPDDVMEPRFSPVLTKEDEVAGVGGTDGLRVAHLRVIFELPSAVITAIQRLGLEEPGKLAYVQWYTKLGRRDPDCDMFKVSRETRFIAGAGAQKERATSVIPALDIRRSCQLVPRLPRNVKRMPDKLTSDNVLEDWDGEFWLNHFHYKAMYRSLL